MYQLYKALSILRDIDIEILTFLEHNLNKYKFVPVKLLSKKLKTSEEAVENILKYLKGYGLIKVKKSPYFGVALEPYGLDLISLHYLKVKNQISGLLGNIGVGKESYVLKGISPINEILAVKIFRLGFPSFKSVVRSRNISPIDVNWFILSKDSAKREFNNLIKAWESKVSVPMPKSIANNVVLLEYIDGILLSEIDKELISEDMVDLILENVIRISKNAHLVHGDLSAYNIIIRLSDLKPFIIDWGQAVPLTSKYGMKFLERDLFNISTFFTELGYSISHKDILNKIL